MCNYVPGTDVIATDGAQLDFAHVRQDIVADAERFRIRRLGHDAYMAVQLSTELQDEGLEVVGIQQSVKQLSDPMKWIYSKVRAGVLHHDNNPVMNWMTSNVVARLDHNDNIFPCKERPDNKIDVVSALIMAMNLALNAPEEAPMDLTVYAI